MVDDTGKSTLESIAERLLQHSVRFMVIGGQAEVLYGSSRVTYDVDLCYEATPDNGRRLRKALKTMHPVGRGLPPDRPFRFRIDFGILDLIKRVEPIGMYSDIALGAQSMKVGGLTLSVIGLDHLIQIKRHLGRGKDRESLPQLEALKRLMSDMKGE